MRLLEPPEIPAPGALLFCGPPRHSGARAKPASPESIATTIEGFERSRRFRSGGEYGFRAPRFAQPRNDGGLLVGAFRASWPPVCVKGCRMADDVPFDKSFDLVADQPKQVAPNVRAVAANNPSPFTFKGTVSYII